MHRLVLEGGYRHEVVGKVVADERWRMKDGDVQLDKVLKQGISCQFKLILSNIFTFFFAFKFLFLLMMIE